MFAPEDCVDPTDFVDSDHPNVIGFVSGALGGVGATDRERAVALFLAVRDGFRYDPYNTSNDPADFKASAVVETSRNWCVPKSVLLTAACRASGIPAALGFSDVKNHLQSEKLLASMGTDLFAWHGYSLIFVDGVWRKVSSAFNRELCDRFGTKVLEWDGTHDALMHPYDNGGKRHMEYVRDRGQYLDLPYDALMATFAELYRSFDEPAVVDEMFH